MKYEKYQVLYYIGDESTGHLVSKSFRALNSNDAYNIFNTLYPNSYKSFYMFKIVDDMYPTIVRR